MINFVIKGRKQYLSEDYLGDFPSIENPFLAPAPAENNFNLLHYSHCTDKYLLLHSIEKWITF